MARLPRKESFKTNREPRLIRFRDGLREIGAIRGRLGFTRRRAQTRQHHGRRCLCRVRPGRASHRGQDRSRPYFQHQVHPQFRQCPDTAGECHFLAGMLPPVGSVQRLARLHHLAGQVADHGEGGWLDRHIIQGSFQHVQSWLHQGAVERAGRVQPSYPDSFRFETLRDGFNFRNRAAHHLVGAVVRRDAHPSTGR